MNKDIEEILNCFGITPKTMNRFSGRMLMSNYHICGENGKQYFLKCCPNNIQEEHLFTQKRLVDELRKKSIQTPEMFFAEDGKIGVRFKNRIFVMFEYIEHSLISEWNKNHVNNAGMLLGSLHSVLKEIDVKGVSWIPSLFKDDSYNMRLFSFIEQKSNNPKSELDELWINSFQRIKLISNWLENNLQFFRSSLQWIHGDFHRQNILLDNHKIVGCIDWSNACLGHPYEDIADAYYWFFKSYQEDFLRGYLKNNPIDLDLELLEKLFFARCVLKLSHFVQDYRFVIRLPESKRILLKLLQHIQGNEGI
jgi:Ser/Thr protein kinase RdoA (MazF antagonist)